MSAPTTIKYRGKIYVRATHERCPTGQHWNEGSQRCEKLPPELQLASDHAWKHGKSALATDHGSPEAVRRNRRASRLHTTAAQLAAQHGFHDLSASHRGASARHQLRLAPDQRG